MAPTARATGRAHRGGRLVQQPHGDLAAARDRVVRHRRLRRGVPGCRGLRFQGWDHNDTATRATITGLVAVTRYEVRVRAVGELNTGDWSEAVIGVTAAAAPRFVDGERARREVAENAPGGLAVGAPLTATPSGRASRYEIDLTGLPPGWHQFTVRVYDYRLDLFIGATPLMTLLRGPASP